MNMCFDYNVFKPGKPLAAGTFIIAEQIPGFLRVISTWALFLTVSHVFISSTPPPTRRVVGSAWCSSAPDADWCLRFDGLPASPSVTVTVAVLWLCCD